MRWNPRFTTASSIVLAACASVLTACGGGGGGGGTGTLDLAATDDAFEYDIVQEASISVDRITILRNADSDAGPITLYDGAPILLDLFHLRDGVTQHVAESVSSAARFEARLGGGGIG